MISNCTRTAVCPLVNSLAPHLGASLKTKRCYGCHVRCTRNHTFAHCYTDKPFQSQTLGKLANANDELPFTRADNVAEVPIVVQLINRYLWEALTFAPNPVYLKHNHSVIGSTSASQWINRIIANSCTCRRIILNQSSATNVHQIYCASITHLSSFSSCSLRSALIILNYGWSWNIFAFPINLASTNIITL